MSEDKETFEGTDAEQIEKMRGALAKYRAENQKFREQRDDYKSQLDKSVDNESNVAKFKEKAIKSEAKMRLQSEGIKDVDRLIKRMELSGMSLNDNDEIEGLEEQISELKSDFPELFDVKRRVGGNADIHVKGDSPKVSVTEMQAAKLMQNL